ncbi:rhodanese-like domain-containing protein [Phaeospirillum tilakii]|uniref:Rhodanese-like domain-containing protein n=1 Tax=Phaeospirillum tilakii TaxID=741673 RepID=A0ABW5CAU6_9PROT
MLARLIAAFRGLAAGARAPVRQADPAEIHGWWRDGAVTLIDVREPDEHRAEAIAGALSLPLSSFDPARVPTPPANGHLVLHCQRGVRCGPAAARLVAAGWPSEIVRMRGGLLAWKRAGFPTRQG